MAQKLPLTKAKLRKLLKRHKWNITAAALAHGITKQGLIWVISREGMTKEAAEERGKRHIPGPRGPRKKNGKPVVKPVLVPAEGERILAALAAAPSRVQAAADLRLSRRSLYRMIDLYKITDAKIESRRSSGASPR